ncbi:MAG: chorismate mutase [Chloroflexota bacterium]|nr:chorismate mutase [Chloroflexota bacterium]
MKCHGIRGATTIDANTKELIFKATKELLNEMIRANAVDLDDMACILFTTTGDLNAAFPAAAAREIGLDNVPLMCSREIDVPDSLKSCLRILILFNTDKAASDIKHIYTGGATALRVNNIGSETSPEV